MKKNKLSLKIVAFIVAICLIAFILSITNSFVGNPISSTLADKAIKEYASKNYPNLDLEIDKSIYNFKFSNYMAIAKSRTSIDTHFSIYYEGGKVQSDDYETYVLGKYNTLNRLQDEYAALVIPILSTVEGLEKNRAMVEVEKWEYEKANENIKLDMNFDRTLPIDMILNIRADLSDNSLKAIANILENSHKILLENNCIFKTYEIFSEYNGVLVMISDVTPSDIESGELEKLLQDAQNYKDEAKVIENGKDKPDLVKRIRVYIKDAKQ